MLFLLIHAYAQTIKKHVPKPIFTQPRITCAFIVCTRRRNSSASDMYARVLLTSKKIVIFFFYKSKTVWLIIRDDVCWTVYIHTDLYMHAGTAY